jgi:hypothetical protein
MSRSLAALFFSFTFAHSSSNYSLLACFSSSRWCLSLLSGLFLPGFYIFHPSLVVEFAHLGVQTRARLSTDVSILQSVDCETSQLPRRCVAGTAYSCSQFYNDYQVVWIDVCTPPRHNIYDVRKVSSVDYRGVCVTD